MSGQDDARSVYAGLRQTILTVDPVEVGIAPTPELPRVWGVVMDTGYPNGTATVVALADGTTSLYTSTGGGIIGAGAHAGVAAATRALLGVVEAHLDKLPAATQDDLPPADWVVLRALAYGGQRAVLAEEDELGYDRHPLSPVFHAVHEVITQLRLLDESRRS
jgi:hypothetical protein